MYSRFFHSLFYFIIHYFFDLLHSLFFVPTILGSEAKNQREGPPKKELGIKKKDGGTKKKELGTKQKDGGGRKKRSEGQKKRIPES